MMRMGFLLWFVFFIFIFSNRLNAQEIPPDDLLYENVMSGTLVPFFTACKNGDVEAITEYISDDMYEKNKVLLEQNKEYPEFLRNFYRDAIFQEEKIVKSEETIFVNVIVTFPGGYQSVAEYRLNERESKAGNTVWKITDLVNNSY